MGRLTPSSTAPGAAGRDGGPTPVVLVVGVRWWFRPYMRCLLLACWLSGATPKPRHLQALLQRAAFVRHG